MASAREVRYYLQSMLVYRLMRYCPVLSGSMKLHITADWKIFKKQSRIILRAPFYDLSYWRKTKKIRYTHKKIKGMKGYAFWVNQYGAFCKGNKSKHWVNRTINESCYVTAVHFDSGLEGFLER